MKKIISLAELLRAKSMSSYVSSALRRISYFRNKLRALAGISLSDRALQSAVNRAYRSAQEMAEHFRSRKSPHFFLNPEERGRYVAKVKALFPEKIEATIEEANEVCSHTFDLLGSCPINLGRKIDWRRDFKSGYQWPRVYYREISYRDYEKGYDVKIPRELSRFNHLTTLGKAYWYTDDEKYAQEFISQIDDWTRENPTEVGVNWQCTMDVALRVVNWIWGFYFFKDSKAVTDDFLVTFLKSCLLHGRHIRQNLEWDEQTTSNHYLSDLLGLVFLGLIFPEFRESGEWLSFGTEELLKELQKQVYEDGMDYEASTSYHRLVLELYYSAALLSRLNGYEWPARAWTKIHKMFQFVRGIIKPDGMIPQVGDNDSGRLCILEKRENLAQAYLFPIAAVLFNDSYFKLKKVEFSEEALWLLGPGGYEAYSSLPESQGLDELPSCRFENGGLYTIRAKGDYLLVSCGSNGQNRNGGHAHNDKLSFELQIKGNDIIVDPGTYIYTRDYRLRNLFRSTAYHNTVMVDGKEINDFDPFRLFQLRDNSRARAKFFRHQDSKSIFRGEHSGYERLQFPVRHGREIIFDENRNCWYIQDSLVGPAEARHEFKLFFHFSSRCKVELKAGHPDIFPSDTFKENLSLLSHHLDSPVWKACSVLVGGITVHFSFGTNTPFNLHLEQGWVSRGYGRREEAPVLVISSNAFCPVYFYSFIRA